MQSTRPTATLTDVKNKTGDVFALAEKNGAVMITSYNKPKYVIAKFSVFEELEAAQEKEEKQSQPPQAAETKVEVTTPEPVIMAVPEVPSEPVVTSGPEFEPEQKTVQKPEPEQKTDKKAEEKPVKTTPKVDAKAVEWWDRRSNLEQNWVKSVKNLL